MSDDYTEFVIDFGSHTTRIGLNGHECPNSIFRTALPPVCIPGEGDDHSPVPAKASDMRMWRRVRNGEGFWLRQAEHSGSAECTAAEYGNTPNEETAQRLFGGLAERDRCSSLLYNGAFSSWSSDTTEAFIECALDYGQMRRCEVPFTSSDPLPFPEDADDEERLSSIRAVKCCWIAEPVFNSRQNREKMLEFLFESYGMERVAFVPTTTVQVMSTGAASGLVLDMGHSGVRASAVMNCEWIAPSTQHEQWLGGKYLTDDLARRIFCGAPDDVTKPDGTAQRLDAFQSSWYGMASLATINDPYMFRQAVFELASSLRCLSPMYDGFSDKQNNMEHCNLPDGCTLEIPASCLWDAAQVPFASCQPDATPQLTGIDKRRRNVPQLVLAAIGSTLDAIIDDSDVSVANDDTRDALDDLLRHIVPTGGGKEQRNFGKQLEQHLRNQYLLCEDDGLIPDVIRKVEPSRGALSNMLKVLHSNVTTPGGSYHGRFGPKVHTAFEGQIAAWMGTSIVSTLNTIRPFAFTKSLYDQVGPDVLAGCPLQFRY